MTVRAGAELAYGDAIRKGFEHLFENHDEVFAIGQGLWSPWYVGNTMLELDKKYGKERVIDTPVSELACTGAAVGASLFGYRPIVVHPRMDFMILAADQIVNQAAKWRYMLGGQVSPSVTIRAIINRGGEQGAQHSQALHAWFAHIPGLRVVMPATPRDARDLLIAATLCDDPVLYIDDRWLYDWSEDDAAIELRPLATITPRVLREGEDVTLVGAGFSVRQCIEAAEQLARDRGIRAEVVDLRVLNPFRAVEICSSVRKTGRLLAVDGSWATCGMAGEIIASCAEHEPPDVWHCSPQRLTLPHAPAPTSPGLERNYYLSTGQIVAKVEEMLHE